MQKPLVSVIIPTYNSAKTVVRAINSVRNQTFDDWECIIVDDSSVDNTVSIVKEYLYDKRLKLITLPKNSGVAVARNKGIEKAKGRFIAFLDSDDEWLSGKLEKHIEFMLEQKSFFSFTSYEVMNQLSGKREKIIEAPQVLTYSRELWFNHIGTSTVIYDSQEIGKIFMPNLRKRQDYATWLYILRNFGDGKGLKEILSKYYKLPNSLSSNQISSVKYNWQVYRQHEKLSIPLSVFALGGDILSKVLGIK